MHELPKEFYRLGELAERWDTTEDDVLYMAINSCGLAMSATPSFHNTHDISNDDWLDLSEMIQLAPEDIMEFIQPLIKEPGYSETKSIIPVSVHQRGKQYLCDKKYWLEVFRNDLLVFADEVTRVEEKNPALVNKAPWQDFDRQDSGDNTDFRKAFDEAAKLKTINKEVERVKSYPETSLADTKIKRELLEELEEERCSIQSELDLMTLQKKYPDAPIRVLQEHHSGTGTTEELERILSDPDTMEATLKALEDIDNETRKRFEDLQCVSPAMDKKCNDAENYFILSGDYWKVRFNGGSETIVGAKAPIKTIVEYLRNPHKHLSHSQVYTALHCQQATPTHSEPDTMAATTNVSGLNRDDTKVLSATIIQQCKESVSEMIERKKLYTKQGKTDDVDKIEEEIEKLVTPLNTEYGVILDTETGEVISANRNANGRDQAAENTNLHIKRAIKLLNNVEGLPEHIKDFLVRNKNTSSHIYRPPQDFPQWTITN